ncbi:hypothetical protein KUTeg_007744 [Tegillarca granosa]|uniref:Uncharacterized protein n=1 Tax=Tegillarca granosa TaxID=220873 RepID=A0ABQ9FE44_TEGGR|nr:hypothetical protein KUTeg_007744 [Tegillarca granosa]
MSLLSRDKYFVSLPEEDIPERYHYRHNRRVQPLVLVPEKGYTIVHDNYSIYAGVHGYDNDIADMHPFFIAMGPMFIGGRAIETFNIVDIYPMLCYILQVQPAPNNGSLGNVRFLIKEEEVVQPTFVVCDGFFIWSWRRRDSISDGSPCARVPLLQQGEEDDDMEEDEV